MDPVARYALLRQAAQMIRQRRADLIGAAMADGDTTRIRAYSDDDRTTAVALWQACALTVSHNDPARDIRFCRAPYDDSRWIALHSAVQLFIDRLEGGENEKLAIVTFASDYNSRCGEVNLAATTDQGLSTDLSLASQAMDSRSTSWVS